MGKGDLDPLSSPEQLQRLRVLLEGLRAVRVSAAVREQSGRRRVVTVGREPLEGCLRKLRQAQRGWEGLVAEAGPEELPERKQERLLDFLDQGLALLGRIEALKSRRKRRRGAIRGDPEGGRGESAAPSGKSRGACQRDRDRELPPPPPQPLPTLEETRAKEAGESQAARPGKAEPSGQAEASGENEEEEGEQERGGGGRDREGEEEDDGEDEEEEEEAGEEEDRSELGVVHQEMEGLQEEVFALQGKWWPLHQRVTALEGAFQAWKRTQTLRLMDLTSDLKAALALSLRQKVGSALEDLLPRLPAEKGRGWPAKVMALVEALCFFLLEGDMESLPLEAKMGAWKKEAADLQEKLLALNWASWEAKKGNLPGVACVFTGNGLLKMVAEVDKAVAALQEALREVPRKEVGAVQQVLGALRRGALEELGAVSEKQCAVEDALQVFCGVRDVPLEEKFGALREKVRAVLEAMNRVSPKDVGLLQEKVGGFLGVGGESSREILTLLGIPWKEMRALERNVDAVKGPLYTVRRSEDMASAQEKVDAVAQAVGALKDAMRAAGLEEAAEWERLEALQNYVRGIPLKDLAALDEKLVILRGALQGKAGAPDDGPLMEVGEVADRPAEIQRMPSPGGKPLVPMSACNIWTPEPLMSSANQPAQRNSSFSRLPQAQNVAGAPFTSPVDQTSAPTQFLPPNAFPSSGKALSVSAGTAGSLAVQAGISQGQAPGAAVPPLGPHDSQLSDPVLPGIPLASVLVPWPQAPLWFAAPQAAVAAGQIGPKSFIGMIPIPAAGLDPVVPLTPSSLLLGQPRERSRGVNTSTAPDPRAVSACANAGTILAAVSPGSLAQAGANQMHVVAGGRRDQETSVISKPPFPTSLGTPNLLMKDGTSYSVPGNPTGSVSASGFPSDPGVRRTWREEITLEERHHLVQKFAETISGGNHSTPRMNGPMEIPILYAKEVEEKIYRLAVSKNDYRKLLAVELRKIEKELQGKQGCHSSTPRVLGNQPTAWGPGASSADVPPMAAIMGLVELGIPRGPAVFSGPWKRRPGVAESSANPNMEDPQPSPPSGLDDTRRPRRQDPQPPEEKRHAGSSGDALAECDQDVTQMEASEPPPKKQKTDATDCTQRAILVQELLAAYRNYANYVTAALNQDRDELDKLVIRLLGPSNQPNLLKEAEGARALTKALKKTLVLLKCFRDEDPGL